MLKEKGGQCISNGLLMIVGPSTCEVDVVYVGITLHLPTQFLKNVCAYCLYARVWAIGLDNACNFGITVEL